VSAAWTPPGTFHQSAASDARVVIPRNAHHPTAARLSFGSFFEPREQSRWALGDMDVTGRPFTSVTMTIGYAIGYRDTDPSRHAQTHDDRWVHDWVHAPTKKADFSEIGLSYVID
jgi:hypothetical protein